MYFRHISITPLKIILITVFCYLSLTMRLKVMEDITLVGEGVFFLFYCLDALLTD